MSKVAVALIVAILSSCTSSTSRPASEDLVGEWEKREQTLPPVHLSITRDSAGLSARLRLSGTERVGRVTVDGPTILMQFAGIQEPMRARLPSKAEMHIDLTPGSTQVLNKRPRR